MHHRMRSTRTADKEILMPWASRYFVSFIYFLAGIFDEEVLMLVVSVLLCGFCVAGFVSESPNIDRD